MNRTRSLALPGLCACFLAGALSVRAQGAPAVSSLWTDVSERTVAGLPGERGAAPQAHRTLALDLDALRQRLAAAPLESAGPGVTLELPRPDGGFARFSVVESPVMEAGLQAKFPELRTYRGQGIDEPAATVRFDTTPQGFHAQVLAPSGRVFIDPAVRGETRFYVAFYTRDASRAANPFRCDLSDPGADSETPRRGVTPQVSSGTQLRTYRLALAATGEYSTAVCAPNPAAVGCALSAMVTSMNRVDGIYETEVAIRMVLIANDNLLIYTNGATDPYTNNNGNTMLGQNQTNIDAVIGTANYDIGHVFSTGGGGVAQLGVPCGASKARGVTGNTSPIGDGFDVDYVAHEMGHQWGANHTFNGTTGSCGGGNRSNAHAYEPGSGTSIMAYAGICGAEDIQPHSDPYFHTDSFDAIVTYSTVGAGNSCAVTTATGNTPPVPVAGSNFTIPNNTAFELTGSGSDTDPGDNAALTFDWQEFDHGAAAPPNTDDGVNRAIFREFNPTVAPSRTFPRLAAMTPPLGEAYPTSNRTFNFRMIVRDNRSGGGGVNYSAMQVTSNTTAGPFLVTAPNTAVTWTIGSTPTVTWNVANTTASPVSCANVNITLSYDGGQTFPVTLAASTPNDGSEVVTVPGPTGTTQARVKVKCANNIFLDLSDVNFTIGASPVELQGFSVQ